MFLGFSGCSHIWTQHRQGASYLKTEPHEGRTWGGVVLASRGSRKAANHIRQTCVLGWRRFGTVVLPHLGSHPVRIESRPRDGGPKHVKVQNLRSISGESCSSCSPGQNTQHRGLPKSSWLPISPVFPFCALALLTLL